MKEEMATTTAHMERVSSRRPQGFVSSLAPRILGPESLRWAAIVSLAMMFQIALGGVYTVNSILVQLNQELGPGGSFTWLISAPTLASAVMGIVLGQLGDVFGRRWVSLFTGISAIIACIIALPATNINMSKSAFQ